MHILSFDWADAQAMSSTIVTEQKAAIRIADRTLQVRRIHLHADAELA